MARKTTNFLVGIFVIGGIALGMAAVIWIGVTGYFQQGEMYVTYMKESVQGLAKDSTVKFLGVEVGRVDKVRVAPDNQHIGVYMKIDMRGDLSQTVTAQLKAAGITGVMYIDLDYRKPGDLELAPKVDFPAEYPIIPSKPSEISQIISGVQEVVEKLRQVDTQGISAQIITTTRQMEQFLKGAQMTAIMNKVEAASANLQALTAKGNQIVQGIEVKPLLGEAQSALQEVRNLSIRLKEDLEAFKLREVGFKTRNIATEIQGASANLKKTTETLELLVERLYERPPDLFFGKPPQKRFNE